MMPAVLHQKWGAGRKTVFSALHEPCPSEALSIAALRVDSPWRKESLDGILGYHCELLELVILSVYRKCTMPSTPQSCIFSSLNLQPECLNYCQTPGPKPQHVECDAIPSKSEDVVRGSLVPAAAKDRPWLYIGVSQN